MPEKLDAGIPGTDGPAPQDGGKEQSPPRDFETALAQLEELVTRMEGGALPLDQSLAAYEKGVELARLCQGLLDAAEQQVKVLQGSLLRPFNELPDCGDE